MNRDYTEKAKKQEITGMIIYATNSYFNSIKMFTDH